MPDPAMNAEHSLHDLRSVAWREVCPWLILLRTFRLAVSLPILVLATCGALLTPLGWRVSGMLFSADLDADPYFAAVIEQNGRWPDVVAQPGQLIASRLDAESAPWRWENYANLPAVYCRFTEPFRRLVDANLTAGRIAYHLFGAIWNVAVWALLAGAITRLAAVQLGRDERLSVSDALRHVRRNYAWYFLAPFFPIAGVFLTALPLALLGLLMRTSAGVLLAGILWIFALLAGLVMAVLLLGLLFGWPLLWPTLSSEQGSDAFDAFSRSYFYTFQRPLEYLLYAVVLTVFGGLGWLLVSGFAGGVVELASWAAAWGAGGERLSELLEGQPSGLAAVGAQLIRLLNALVLNIAAGFNYALFFCASTAVFLLLRRQVDQTEFDEVFTDEETDGNGLPAWRAESEGPAEEDSLEHDAQGTQQGE